jgi:hypothetical protein
MWIIYHVPLPVAEIVFGGEVSSRPLLSAPFRRSHLLRQGGVAGVVEIESSVVSGVFNLESSGVGAPNRRARHDRSYHEGSFLAAAK